MLDFAAVRNKEMSWQELADPLTIEDLRDLTDEMVDVMLDMIANCVDADVVLVPDDPEAKDTFAADSADVDLAWTLGHVIVHTTASAEESAFMAAELARGVELEQRRSRSERPWEAVTTVAQCRHRLEESRRMRLASLDVWPDDPYLDNAYLSSYNNLRISTVMRFILGLSHDDSHLGQIKRIVAQAKAARAAV